MARLAWGARGRGYPERVPDGSRVALVRATSSGNTALGESFEEKKLAESLALASLDAYLAADEDEWDVLLVNPVLDELSAREAAARVVAHQPGVVGLSLTYQWQQEWATALAQAVKAVSPRTHVVVGGMFATSAWARLLDEIPFIDSVCRGEGEYTFLELAQRVRADTAWGDVVGLGYRDLLGRAMCTDARPRIRTLGDLPFPTRTQLPAALAAGGVIQIEASRGCSAHCTFCDVRKTGWVGRPARHFVDELEALCAAHPGEQVWIVDNIFIGFGKGRFERAEQIAQEILDRGIDVRFAAQDRVNNTNPATFALLKQAGLNRVYLGVESFAGSALERWEKGATAVQNMAAIHTLRDLGIYSQIGFLVFDGDTTLDEIDVDIKGLRRACKDNAYLHLANFNELIPYTGTHLEAQYRERFGRVPDTASTNVWEFGAEVQTVRDHAHDYLEAIWPATEVIVSNYDDPDAQAQMHKTLPTKNRCFVDYLDGLLSRVVASAPRRELESFSSEAVTTTRTDLLDTLRDWDSGEEHDRYESAFAAIGIAG